jgi:hypothetical protein
VPCMSDLNPPSQNRPGGKPSRIRTAIRRAARPVPRSSDLRRTSSIVIFTTLMTATGPVCRCCRLYRRFANKMSDARRLRRPPKPTITTKIGKGRRP